MRVLSERIDASLRKRMLPAMLPHPAAYLALFALACEHGPALPGAEPSRVASSAQATVEAAALVGSATAVVRDPASDVQRATAEVPSTTASTSSEPRPSPLSSASPVVPKSERDPAVELCCKMFDPYVTGCVAGGVCYAEIRDYCRSAWQRGASLSDIEPGLRRMVSRRRYFMPKPCLRRVLGP